MSAIKYTKNQATRALVIGLGVGSLNRHLQQYGIVVDTVEIEPAVVKAAQKHFLWQPNGFVAIEDAYHFLQRQHSANIHSLFDYIVVDVFTARRRKISRLYTADSMHLLKSQVKPDGVIAVNLVTFARRDPSDQHPRLGMMMFNTLKRAFKHVRCFIDNDPLHTPADEAINLICFGSDSELIFKLPEQSQYGHDTEDDIFRRFQSWEIRFSPNSGEVFTSNTQSLIDAEDDVIHQSIQRQIEASLF